MIHFRHLSILLILSLVSLTSAKLAAQDRGYYPVSKPPGMPPGTTGIPTTGGGGTTRSSSQHPGPCTINPKAVIIGTCGQIYDTIKCRYACNFRETCKRAFVEKRGECKVVGNGRPAGMLVPTCSENMSDSECK